MNFYTLSGTVSCMKGTVLNIPEHRFLFKNTPFQVGETRAVEALKRPETRDILGGEKQSQSTLT